MCFTVLFKRFEADCIEQLTTILFFLYQQWSVTGQTSIHLFIWDSAAQFEPGLAAHHN